MKKKDRNHMGPAGYYGGHRKLYDQIKKINVLMIIFF